MPFSMNSLIRALCATLFVAAAFAFSGCTSKTSDDSSIPWSRPAGWEGNIPGMGDPGDTSGVH